MKDNIKNKVLLKVRKYKKGTIFFSEDFLNFGNAKAIAKVLERLHDDKILKRIARGMYIYPEVDKATLGIIFPSDEEIAKAIVRRDRARIIPGGNMSMNLLGISSKVSNDILFLTNGSARILEIENRKIIFKKAAPKNFMTIGKVSTLVVQALKEIGKENLTIEEEQIFIKHLLNEEKKKLEYDIRFVPEWIRVIFRKVLNQKNA